MKVQLKGILQRHEGHSQAITAGELAVLTESNDRAVRLDIVELIHSGLPVLSATENPPGYFLAMPVSWKGTLFLASSRIEWVDMTYHSNQELLRMPSASGISRLPWLGILLQQCRRDCFNG